MKLHFIFYFLILISLIACNESKNKIDSDLLLSLAISTPDRAENYDRDVQIITNLSTFTNSGGVEITCQLGFAQQDIDYYIELLKKEIARYPRGYWIKAGVDKIVLCKSMTTADGRTELAFSDINLIAISVTQPMYVMRYGTTTCGGIPNFNSFECYDQPAIHHELTHSVDRKISNLCY